MNTEELLVSMILYCASTMFIVMVIISIRHLIKAKNSNGISKISFWITFIALCMLDIYAIYYRLIELIVSYIIQTILYGIYLFLIYKYEIKNDTKEYEQVESMSSGSVSSSSEIIIDILSVEKTKIDLENNVNTII